MISTAVLAVLAASIPLGMLHAMDTDHVLAVSALSSRSGSDRFRPLRYAAHWAIGHGGLLLVLAIAAFGFHIVVPTPVPYWAERVVGVILIASGVAVFAGLARETGLGVARGAHAGAAHGIRSGSGTLHAALSPATARAPLLVGIVHGLAGSAPALALAPAALMQPAAAVLYIGTFSLGVLVGMVAFGFVLGRCQSALTTRAPMIARAARGALGAVAIGFGVMWLAS